MPIRLLRVTSLTYLLLPNIIFVVTWFRTVVSLAVLLGWCFVIWWQFKDRIVNECDVRISGRSVIILLLLGFFMSAISGVDGYFYQNYDYWGHNSKYFTLFIHSWPVVFQENQQYASHYFGFYLLPALFSKLQGEISGTALLIWASIGYWIALMWLWVISNKNAFSLFLFFILGSAGHLIKIGFYNLAGLGAISLPFVTEVWPVLYQSILAINQTVPAMIVAAVIYADFRFDHKPERSFLLVSLNFIFGIFPTITFGLVYIVILLYTYRQNINALFSKEKWLQMVIPGLTILPVFIYFLSGGGTVVTGFIWEFDRSLELLPHYSFGVILEIFILIVLMHLLGLQKDQDRYLILALIVILVLVSTYRIGKWNDWFMRGQMPVMMLLLLFIINKSSEIFEMLKRSFNLKTIIVFILITGFSAVIPVRHLMRAFQNNVFVENQSGYIKRYVKYPYDRFHDFYQMGKVIYSIEEANQYLGKKGSVYERYLARQKK